MKTKISIIIIYILCGINVFAKNSEFERKINKTFVLGESCNLSINNKHGKIKILTWDKNEVFFEITIKSGANREPKARKMLNSVDVDFNTFGKSITVLTNIKTNEKCKRCNISVDYKVMVPKNINLYIYNKYGDITLAEIKGEINIDLRYGNVYSDGFLGKKNKIEIKYGDLHAEKLMGEKNNLILGYGKRTYIKQITKANIIIGYSKLKIDNAEELIVNSRYSDTEINEVKNLRLNLMYANCNIGNIETFDASCNYSNLQIDKLNQKLYLSEISYGKLNIDYVSPNISAIDVDARYTDIKIRFDSKTLYEAELYTRYHKISIPKNANVTYKEEQNNSEHIKYYIGKKTSLKTKIKITNKYAKIDIE